MTHASPLANPLRAIWISGASSGFGRAAALRLASTKKPLVLLARRIDRLEELCREVEAQGGTACARELDVRDRMQTERVMRELPDAFATPDVLINSAGGARGLEPVQSANLDDWEWMVDANIRGMMVLSRIAIERMLGDKRGHVVNLGSVAGEYPYVGGNVYGASKAFVRQFSLNLRADLLGTQIRVTDIEPGMAETEFALSRFSGDQARAHAVYAGMRPLSADDVADNICYCLGLPWHVNINRLEVMPTAQAFGSFAVHRQP